MGFQGLEFQGLGFRGLGFQGWGVIGFRFSIVLNSTGVHGGIHDRNDELQSLQGPLPSCNKGTMWRFPKIRGTILGVPIIRTMVYWGLYWGTLILGNYHEV